MKVAVFFFQNLVFVCLLFKSVIVFMSSNIKAISAEELSVENKIPRYDNCIFKKYIRIL